MNWTPESLVLGHGLTMPMCAKRLDRLMNGEANGEVAKLPVTHPTELAVAVIDGRVCWRTRAGETTTDRGSNADRNSVIHRSLHQNQSKPPIVKAEQARRVCRRGIAEAQPWNSRGMGGRLQIHFGAHVATACSARARNGAREEKKQFQFQISES